MKNVISYKYKEVNYHQKEIQCSGQGEIQFRKYEDSTGCGENGCDFYFKNVVIDDEDGNVQHRVNKTDHVSEKHGNKNTIYFSTVVGLDEIFEVQIPTGKNITISFEAWDEGSDSLENIWTDLVVPFSKKNTSNDWSYYYYYKTKNKGKKFWFKYRVTGCDPHFTGLGCNSCVTDRYGGNCSIFCRPSPGFYTCSAVGEKICEDRRGGENCTACQEQFTGDDCEKCAENFYPEGDCEVYCPSAPNRYTCTEKGQIQCLQNRTGSDCEDCISRHYGEDCSKFCQETDNYTCDESGGNICKEHFYPAEKCDINCQPVPGSFTCNQTTGQRISTRKDLNIKMMVIAGGGGGIFVILVITVVIVKIRRDKNEDKVDEEEDYANMDDGNEVTVYSRVNRGSARSTFNGLHPENPQPNEAEDSYPTEQTTEFYPHSNEKRHNKKDKNPSSEEEAAYSKIPPTQEHSPEEDKDTCTYACLKRDGERTNMMNQDTYKDEEDANEVTYAEVSFVRKRGREDLMKYRHTRLGEHAHDGMETKREDATYMTVADIVKETF